MERTLKTPLRRSALALAALLALAGAAQAQSSNATLRGAVIGGNAANADVRAVNVATGQVLHTKAGANGSYALAGLPPGTYRVTVTGSDGSKSETTITLQVGESASADLALSGGATQQITVTGAGIVEKKTSEVGTYVTPQQLQRLPQVTRNFLSQADLAPGVNVEYDKDGNVKLRAGATARSAINVFIDGVSQKDFVLRGGVTGQDNSRGNPFPQSALAEYKVITQNYKAEYDQVGSAAITAATKSGTNEFKGDAFFDRTQASWRSKTPEEAKAGGAKANTHQEQFGASLGGAIVKDKVHFFAAYEGKKNSDPKSITAGGPSGAGDLLPAAAKALLGPTSSPFNEDLFFGKVDVQLADEHKLDLNVKVRQEKDRKHLDGQESAEFSADNKVDEKRFWARHQWGTQAFTNEATVTYEDSFFTQDPVNFVNGKAYMFLTPNGSQLNDQTVLRTGGSNFYQRKGQKGYGLQDDFTLGQFEAGGTHLMKLGLKVKSITVSAIEQFNPLPQFYYALNGRDPNTPYKVEFGAPLSGIGNGGTEARNNQLGVYVQDDWDVSKALQVNLGVRYDYERSPTYLSHVTPADVVAALNGKDPNDPTSTYAQTLAKGGVNVNDYISTGGNRKAFRNAIQPRLGFSLDLTGNKQAVLYGGWGRSYDRNIFDIIQLEKTKGTFPNYNVGFSGPQLGTTPWCTAGATCVPYNPNYQNSGVLVSQFATGSGREINLLNNDLKVPYSDQLSLGLRYTLADWQTEATISQVQSKDGFVFLLGNRRPGGLFYEQGRISGPPWGYPVPGQGALILGTNGIESKTTALFLRADKPYTKASGWGTTFTYTYSSSKENHNSQDDFTYLLDYPTVANAPFLRASTVPEHKVVATGTYDGPWGTVLSGKLTFASPLTIRDFNCSSGECIGDVAYKRSTRLVDVSVLKSFDIGGGVKLNLRADVINLFDYSNWDGFNVNWGNPTTTVPNGSITTPPRTLKLGIGASW